MKIELNPSYLRALKKFVKNNKDNAESVKKATSLFKSNPNHPSLNLEKLKGSHYWTIRIDKLPKFSTAC